MWLYNNEVFDPEPNSLDPKKVYGFVYLITNTLTGKKYIGKKFFFSLRTKKIKGRKNKKRLKVESDWRKYYGSNKQLQADVENLGPDKFRREILRMCETKSECAYYELKEQLDREAILTEEYYNDWIAAKVTRKHLARLQK